MIGRAAQGRPWIFREIAHFLATGEHLPPPEVRRSRAGCSSTCTTTTAVRRIRRRAHRAQAHRLGVRACPAARVSRAMNTLETCDAQVRVSAFSTRQMAVRPMAAEVDDHRAAGAGNKKKRSRRRSMSKKHIEECVRDSLEATSRTCAASSRRRCTR
jgi:tRNA-dihydrouridine synthase